MSYEALVEGAAGWNEFFGFTMCPVVKEEASESDTTSLATIPCLVFEQSSEGPLLSFLKKSEVSTDWAFVLKVLEEIGSGLHELHKKGIVHRYVNISANRC